MEYLKSRALSGVNAQSLRLGYVENPLAGHELYRGMLAIPYLTRSGVVTMRFRAIPPHEGPKYRSVPGDEPRMFNTNDLCRREPFVCITEGEFDAMTAHQAGLPAVGIAGVNGWKPYFARAFKGYAAVYILCDNDDKGQGKAFGEKVAAQVTNSRIVILPEGHDVNSFVATEGPDALLDKLEVKR
ncbi:toprim domain-containing protein [Catellatospora sichuanensis]|uniref:toprim domain-containing protein n=1 Tax=Catellatospora sichuanensis TaxID=1969805 RepID=UPI001FEA00D0|nr:toprim domain-containing protein [Catellatospora sichuanensis]